MASVQFDIGIISETLKEFQRNFTAINDSLAMKREDVTDDMVSQLVEGYVFLNDLLSKGMDLFTPAGLHSLLEMNHIVLCGADPEKRLSYYRHITETRRRFLKRIKPIRAWVLKKRDAAGPWKLASGFYAQVLSQPQLFLEGNNRTGNILLNYLLVSRGEAPYVICPRTAKEYLDISGDIKFTDKDNSLESTLKLPGHLKKLRSFLKQRVDIRFLAGKMK